MQKDDFKKLVAELKARGSAVVTLSMGDAERLAETISEEPETLPSMSLIAPLFSLPVPHRASA